ncbi:MAG: glycosyltransferase family 9 protein [Gemmatimonadetes bacterium]|nr:glycosyltransferase family 9 protein [Gemmatimonadota bacterium]
MRNLRAHWPDAWISMVVDTPYVEALATVEELDEIVEMPVRVPGLGENLRRWKAVLGAVAAAPFDLAFDFQRNERAQILLLVSRAPTRATLWPLGQPLRRRWVYTDVLKVTPEDDAALHTVDLSNRLLETLGVPAPFRVPILPVSEEQRASAQAILRGHGVSARPGRPLLMVHPGSGAEARRWPPARFAAVADHTVERHQASVVVLSGPREKELAASVTQAMRESATLVEATTSIPTLAALLAEADLLLCNDSGPMHVAAAVGTPVCALYGAQSAVAWAPLGSAGHRTLQPPLPCGSECVAQGTCVPGDPMHSYCVRRVGVDDVVRTVDAQLGDGAASVRSVTRNTVRPGADSTSISPRT